MFKRPVAILLLFIHLFNMGGQLAFYQYAVLKAEWYFDKQISKNLYNVDDLTEIRVPANLPDITEWKKFQPVHGRVQFRDASYNYVKMKVTRHAIYLFCIPNYATTRLSDHNVVYALQISDIPVPKKDHVPFGKINHVPCNTPVCRHEISAPSKIVRKVIANGKHFIPDPLLSGPVQPPDRGFYLS